MKLQKNNTEKHAKIINKPVINSGKSIRKNLGSSFISQDNTEFILI